MATKNEHLPFELSELLGDVTWCASVFEVGTQIPDAYSPPRPTKVEIPEVGEAAEFLTADHVSFMSHTFTVRFYFHCGRLRQVMLSQPNEHSNVPLRETFLTLSAELRRRHGNESGREEKRSPVLNIDSLRWTLEAANVTLVMLEAKSANRNHALNLNYQDALIQA